MNKNHHNTMKSSPLGTKLEEILGEDQSLLESFFAEARTPMPDDGFVERVMEALPERRTSLVTLSSLSRYINIVGAVAVLVLTVILLGNYISSLPTADFSFSLSALFVNSVLFMHRLFGYIPHLDFQQVVGIAAATILLMTLFIQRCANLMNKTVQ